MVLKIEELKDVISDVVSENCTIGLHGIKRSKGYTWKKERIKTNMERVFSIFNSGLNVTTTHSAVHGTVMFLGSSFENEFENDLKDYRWHDSINFIIIAIPENIKSGDGRELYIGKPSSDTFFEMNMDEDLTSMAEAIFYNLTRIPSSFILGNYRLLDNGMVNFTYNPNFIGFRNNQLTEEEFDLYKTSYDDYCSKMGHDFAFNTTRKQKEEYHPELSELRELPNRTREILANPDTVQQAISDMSLLKKIISKMRQKINSNNEKKITLR